MRRDAKIICGEYLDFIRSQPCIGCGRSPAEPHHLQARGQRESKRNDFTAVPVTRDCHEIFERLGITGAQAAFHVDPWREALMLTVEFFAARAHEVLIKRGKI